MKSEFSKIRQQLDNKLVSVLKKEFKNNVFTVGEARKAFKKHKAKFDSEYQMFIERYSGYNQTPYQRSFGGYDIHDFYDRTKRHLDHLSNQDLLATKSSVIGKYTHAGYGKVKAKKVNRYTYQYVIL